MANRFVTPEAILQRARERAAVDRRNHGYGGPVGAIKLDTHNTIKAFLDYFDEMEEDGWFYIGMVEYPDLPYGGCYVFRKNNKAIVESQIKVADDQPIKPVVEKKKIEQVIDMYNDKEEDEYTTEDLDELMDAPASVVNEIMFKQQKVLTEEERKSDLLDEIANTPEIIEEDPDPVNIRHQFYKQYTDANPNKKAVFRGQETKQFKVWLDEKRAANDPIYQEYLGQTGKPALMDEKETKEYSKWFAKRQNDLRKNM